MHPRVRYFGGAFLRARIRRQAARFLAQTLSPREVQQATLARLLQLNAGTHFAREHRLHEVRSLADLQARVPVGNFEYYRPWIERLKQGETSALLGPRNPLLMFALTSGTTSESKFIPITRPFLDDYRAGWKVWGIRAMDDHPVLHLSDIVQLSSDHDQFRSPGGHPCGNISGLVAAMQSPLVKTMYCVPDVVAKIPSADAKYYTALRLAIANPRVGLVMTANPSTLVHLARQAELWREPLIRDIANGSLSPPADLPPQVRARLAPRIRRPNPARARQLEALILRHGRFAPRDFWPQLALLAVWTGGSAGAYVPALRPAYGDVPVRDHGLSASEGRMTIPFADHSPAGVLDIGTHVFEFIPESEYGSASPTVLAPHELHVGHNYYILLTTSSGLCRYDICDVVRCTGFLNATPQLEFLHKGAHMANITGEKLSESQVVAAVAAARQKTGQALSHFTLAPVWGETPGYRLLVEQSDFPLPAAASDFVRVLELELQRQNCEYAEKRNTSRLVPVQLSFLPDGAWRKFTRERQSRLGGSIEQYKHPCLVPDLKFHEQLVASSASLASTTP